MNRTHSKKTVFIIIDRKSERLSALREWARSQHDPGFVDGLDLALREDAACVTLWTAGLGGHVIVTPRRSDDGRLSWVDLIEINIREFIKECRANGVSARPEITVVGDKAFGSEVLRAARRTGIVLWVNEQLVNGETPHG